MLGMRLILGVPLFFLMIGFIWLDARNGSAWALSIFQAFFCSWAVAEYYRLVRLQGHKPFTLLGIIGCFLLYITQQLTTLHPPTNGIIGYDWLLFTVIIIAILLYQPIFRCTEQAIGNIATTIFGITYFWLLLSFLGRMRYLELKHGWEYDGLEFVFIFFCGSKICDIFGLLVGKRFGYHKLWPSISPKKSWEGFIGGMLASVGLIALVIYFHPESAMASIGWARALPLGIILATLGLMGDLVESSLKREAQIKDTGGSLPGYGGVMDLLDSLVLNAPITYIYLIWVCGAKPAVF